jgi:hypothetical protein
MKVTFTGSRNGMSHWQESQFVKLLHEWQITELHHGMSGRADIQAHDLARRCGRPDLRIVAHSSTLNAWRFECDADEIREPLPPLQRNHIMVDETEGVAAGPDGPERLRSGTWSTVRYARKQNREIRILERSTH